LFGIFNEDATPLKSLQDLINSGDPVFSEAGLAMVFLIRVPQVITGELVVISVAAIDPSLGIRICQIHLFSTLKQQLTI